MYIIWQIIPNHWWYYAKLRPKYVVDLYILIRQSVGPQAQHHFLHSL